jgi:ADP-heptose:LPS heptosyltransferase
MAQLFHRVLRMRNCLPGREGILLIFAGGIGDMVSLSPAIRGLARQQPELSLGILTKGAGVGDTLTSCPYVDRIAGFEVYEGTPYKWWEWLKALCRVAWRRRYTTAVLTIGTGWTQDHRIWGLLLLYATGARRRIAFSDECDPWRNAPDPILRLPLANEVISPSQPQRTDRYLELFRKVGLLSGTEPVATEVWISEDDRRAVARLDERFASRRDPHPIVLVFPSVGSGPGKQWLPARYVKVINDLVAVCGAHVFLDGEERDIPLCRTIGAVASPCGNLAGRHSHGALPALIHLADLVIAGDSGPIHIAAAAGTPAVAIFGPTDPRVWAPKSQYLTVLRTSKCPPCENPYACARGPGFPCMTDVTVSDVVDACRRILDNCQARLS